MSKHGLAILQMAVVFALIACTSSSTPTGAGSNSSYDSAYREPTRSSASQGDANTQLQAEGDAPLTIMYISAETGDMYPGQDYYIYAVVDKPKDREAMQYVWSIANGTMSEAPESERARLTKLVEDGYATASATPAEEIPAGETPAGGAAAAGETPAAGTGAAAAATGGAAQTPAAGGPPGSALPGGSGTPSAGGQSSTTGAGDAKEGVFYAPGEKDAPAEIKALIEKDQLDHASMTKDEIQKLLDWRTEHFMPGGAKPTAWVQELRVVGGPDTETEGEATAETAAESKAEDEAAAKKDAAEDDAPSDQERVEPAGAANVGEEATAEKPVADKDKAKAKATKDDLRSEYEAWKDGDGDTRRRGLGSYGEDEEATDDEITAEESFDRATLRTSEPFILWTPDKPGNTKLYLKLAWKEDDLTEPRELELEVRLHEPVVKLGDDFPDVVREDDAFFVKLDGENIPAFQKGLFTVTFDNDKLSFRDVELGEFFDDAPNASVFYAQPDKNEGKVLIAVDTNTELSELTGDGPLVYMKFKAKADLSTRDDAQLAMVTDTTARYILDGAGDNVLPMPVERAAFKTDTIMPPVTEFKRDNTPGQNTPATPGQQPAGAAGAGAGAGAVTPPTGGAAQTPASGTPSGGGGGKVTPGAGGQSPGTGGGTPTPPTGGAAITGTGGRPASGTSSLKDKDATDEESAVEEDASAEAAAGKANAADSFVGPVMPAKKKLTKEEEAAAAEKEAKAKKDAKKSK
jgi:hypothetical protein